MKKFISLLSIYLIIFLQSCYLFNPCGSSDFRTFYMTIESAKGFLFSYDQNGIFPEVETFNREELGILIGADSISERVEVSQLFRPLVSAAYACDDPTDQVYTNAIDSINVFSKYNFNATYPAGSNVNEILNPIDFFGEVFENVPIDELSVVELYLKFSSVPQSDSMQFVITGKIEKKGNFSIETDLVILSD